MSNILNLIAKSRYVKELLRPQNNKIKPVGVSGAHKAALTAALFSLRKKPVVVVVTKGRDELREIRRDLNAFLAGAVIREFYPDDFSEIDNSKKSLEVLSARMMILKDLYEGVPSLTLVTAEAFAQKLFAPQKTMKNVSVFAAGEEYDMDEAVAWLFSAGYEREDIVEAPGQFCVRGGIIDVFPVSGLFPVRIEWLGNDIDSIREFHPDTQRSLRELDKTEVIAIKADESNNIKTACIIDYMMEDTCLVFDEADRIKEEIAALKASGQHDKNNAFGWKQLEEKILAHSFFWALSMFPTKCFPEISEMAIKTRTIAPYLRQMELLASDIAGWLRHGIQPVICMGGEVKAKGMAKNISDKGIRTAYWPEGEEMPSGAALFVSGDILSGFGFADENWLVLTEQDIFGVMKRRRAVIKPKGNKIRYFSEIKSGDYVVHNVHGIGKYIGSETLLVSGMSRDYLVIKYAGDDKLYVPVDQVELLHKYIGADGHVPRLSKMGGSDWSRIRSKAKTAVTELAVELLRLQAERKLLPGHTFSLDSVWQKEFEDAFPYEETPDQLRAVEEIKEDMQKPYPMDRILCGDVGYGKTEVAIRAAFKAVMDSKQVAVLVPTTVLCQQHFITFCERMLSFGINIEMVSRFRTAKEQKKTLEKLAAGQVDILIGTHRLLQNDVVFKDLGLLIIDEEQRFGVSQKEKIKRFTKTVDVLCLSATPIPRTLHMGLVSARDMSIIESPPEDRLPVETYVVEYDDKIVKEAIEKEIRRGGYVYYVYNRVKDIDLIAEKVKKLVPEARIKVAHGQMAEELLENAMIDFYEGHFDVLVCTSIIENGLDVPLANTIIIHGAENFGLSQLYQMRGRVGRSIRLAYAWFLYPKKRALSELAEKRLQAIRDFTDLGAGFRIAMRDLEIRGAGNILGPEQHGHIVSVGFETYCRLLDETMKELSQEDRKEVSRPEPAIDVSVDAYLPDDYIDDPASKLDIYKRLPYIGSSEDMQDFLDEMIDRFGTPPEPVEVLLRLAMLRGLCRSLGIRSITVKNTEAVIIFEEDAAIRPERLLQLVSESRYKGVLRQGPPVTLRLLKGKVKDILGWLTDVLDFLFT